MPQLSVTTADAREVWRSPDGQRIIWLVSLSHEGKTFAAKTYSKAIATVGWSGSIESYDKPGKNGNETFVKQAAKEGGQEASRTQPKDEAAIKAMWAINAAIAFDHKNELVIEELETLAKELFAMVDRVKTGQDTVYTPTEEELGRVTDAQTIKEIFSV